MSEPRVDFFFVGPGKTGTSWLYEFIERKQIASVPTLKEPHIVDLDPKDASAAISSLFSSFDRMCDFSNTSSGDPDNPERIRSHNPEAKVVITTRMPSERIRSHYFFHVRSGAADIGIGPFLDRPENRHVIERSDYASILDRYRSVLPDEQILVLPLEQLERNPQEYVDRLTRFLGADSVELDDQDLEPVLRQAAPRSRTIARVAMWGSGWLRRRRLSRLLGLLKRSASINQLIFRPVARRVADPVDFGSSSAEVERLDAAYPGFVEREAGFVLESG